MNYIDDLIWWAIIGMAATALLAIAGVATVLWLGFHHIVYL